jgi:hypothetical protein
MHYGIVAIIIFKPSLSNRYYRSFSQSHIEFSNVLARWHSEVLDNNRFIIDSTENLRCIDQERSQNETGKADTYTSNITSKNTSSISPPPSNDPTVLYVDDDDVAERQANYANIVDDIYWLFSFIAVKLCSAALLSYAMYHIYQRTVYSYGSRRNYTLIQ